jgi:transposase
LRVSCPEIGLHKIYQMKHKKEKRGQYTEEFKRKVVCEVLSGAISKEAAKRKYDLRGNTQVLQWLRIYEKYGVCRLPLARNSYLSMPQKKKIKPGLQSELEARIKLLEQRLEDESLLREMYSRMINIAEKEYKIDIRKKSNTK